MHAVITPANANDQDVTWRVSPTLRTAKLRTDGLKATLISSQPGTFTVTAILGDFTAECKVIFGSISGVEDITATQEGTHKRLQDGQLRIIHNGTTYGALGEKIQ